MYSQNDEERVILNYFGRKLGELLDIGANDGITLSNSYALIQLGWTGDLVEPSPLAFKRLKALYGVTNRVRLHNFAIATETGTATLHESGSHLGPNDIALLSSLSESEIKKWTRETFSPVEVKVFRYKDTPFFNQDFDFISIDAEGMDFDILTQIDLSKVKMVCVEYNQKNPDQFVSYCADFALREIHRTHENLIFAR